MDSQIINLAKEEYLRLESFVDAFDSRAFTIKAWSVTFSLAGVAGAFVSHAAPVLLIAALSAVLFWIVETYWNGIKSCYYHRIKELEAFFHGRNDDLIPMQILSKWAEQYNRLSIRGFLSAMWSPHITLPHFPIMLISATLYLLSYAKWITV
jgi:uncharacterized membrane protein